MEEIVFEVSGNAGSPPGEALKVAECVIYASITTRGFTRRSSPVDAEHHLIFCVHTREKPRDIDVNRGTYNVHSRVMVSRGFHYDTTRPALEADFVVGVGALESGKLIIKRKVPEVIGYFGDHFLRGLGAPKDSRSLGDMLCLGFHLANLFLFEFALLRRGQPKRDGAVFRPINQLLHRIHRQSERFKKVQHTCDRNVRQKLSKEILIIVLVVDILDQLWVFGVLKNCRNLLQRPFHALAELVLLEGHCVFFSWFPVRFLCFPLALVCRSIPHRTLSLHKKGDQKFHHPFWGPFIFR